MRRPWPAPVPVRSLTAVPLGLRAALVLALVLQCAWYAGVTADARATPEAAPLPPPPREAALRAAALGEPAALARAGTLWLQFFDQQAGISVPFRDLDYVRVRGWLERWLALAPRSDYPLTLAVRVYGQVADPARQREMVAFVRAAFRERPRERWRWLAEAALLARHRIGDLDLALACARALAEQTPPDALPAWARDLRVVILEEMGELEAARLLIGGLLTGGEITDPAEIAFLERWLESLEREQRRSGGASTPPSAGDEARP